MVVYPLQVDVLVNNAGLALGTAGVHQNDIQVLTFYVLHFNRQPATTRASFELPCILAKRLYYVVQQ